MGTIQYHSFTQLLWSTYSSLFRPNAFVSASGKLFFSFNHSAPPGSFPATSSISNQCIRKAPGSEAKDVPLVTFQVAEPVTIPSGESQENPCVHKKVLMEHVFAFSYGQPFVGMCTG